MHPASAALPAPESHPGVARTFDVIVLTDREQRGITSFPSGPRPQAVLAIVWLMQDAALTQWNMSGKLVPLFVKVSEYLSDVLSHRDQTERRCCQIQTAHAPLAVNVCCLSVQPAQNAALYGHG